MSYEEYVNEEAMELTEETPAEESAPAAETAPVEELSLTEESLVDESLTVENDLVDESLIVENDLVEDLADAFEIEYSVDEPLNVPTVDEDLFEVSEEDFGFEIEEEAPAAAAPVDSLQEKCDEIRAVCRDTVSRVAHDLKATNYNPYIRSTTTYRYEIMKKSTDEEPIDVFEFQRTSGFSLRAMAITTALVAAADLAVGKFIKKKLKK